MLSPPSQSGDSRTPLFPQFDLKDSKKVFKNAQIGEAINLIVDDSIKEPSNSKDPTKSVKIASPESEDLKHVMVGEALLTPESHGTIQKLISPQVPISQESS